MFKKTKDSNIKISNMSKNRINFGEVFMNVMFYRDIYPCEFEKHNLRLNHIQKFMKKYSKYTWYKSTLSIKEISNVYMAKVGWIRKLACEYVNCKNYTTASECITCKNYKMDEIFLQDVVNGFDPDKNVFSKKINSIIDRINRIVSEKNTDFNFCTIIKDKYNQYRVIDGNSRLMASAIHDMTGSIICYIGEKI